MPYLTRNQRTRAYGSYNSKKNSFMLSTINNGSCWIPRQARCRGDCLPNLNVRNKRINGTVRVSSSEYQMNKASGLSTQNIIFNYHQPKPGYERNDLELLQWNQSSDRAFPSRFNKMMKVNVPSHGNSTKTSLTRHRPGAGAGGKQYGVDLKHNSYHRYLLKKKGLKPLRGEKQKVDTWKDPKPHQSKAVFEKAIQNNKWRKDSIVANMNHCSLDLDSDCKPASKPQVKPEDLLKYLSVDDNNYMELTGGKGTKEDPFTGKSTNTSSTGDNYSLYAPGTQYDDTYAKITFKAEQDSTVTVYIKSGSENFWDAAFLVLNDDFVSLNNNNPNSGGMELGKIVTVSALAAAAAAAPGSEVAPSFSATADDNLQNPSVYSDFVYYFNPGIYVGQTGNSPNKESTVTLPVLAGDKIKIYYVKDYSNSISQDRIIEFSIYAEPLTSHKELPKSIVQKTDFFKTSLKEVKSEKSPADFFNIKKDFDYIIKPNNKVERITENYSELSIILTDLNHVEDIYSNDAHISYFDHHGKEIKVLVEDLVNGVKLKVQDPVSFKFRTDVANFDAIYEDNKWVCNPPISKQKDDIFVFDMLQNLTLVAQVNK